MTPAIGDSLTHMTRIRSHISTSLDGYIAGPNQGPDHPLGEGGEQLHEWAVATDVFQREHGREGGERTADSAVIEDATRGIGAVVMGRRMFGGGEGPWDLSWKGWWGDQPPFHGPVFVLTHHEREPLTLGDTTFTFVTDGIESALSQAREAAGGQDVSIAGGAQTIQQYLAAGLLDELVLHVAPVVLGGGERLLDSVGTPKLEPVEVVATPAATHMKYRIAR
jgi:dihydrofolate reductase